jgi:phosphoribosyl-ATP pyrophosphohydrolase/phosphoribosyl-AMP cyclohydrolase
MNNEQFIEQLKFDAQGLIPAIIQDMHTKDILMLAYMNRKSLQMSLQSGETVFWSRSRQAYWHKGETSGNTQHIQHITPDCDFDALLIQVLPQGPACHTGAQTCFFAPFQKPNNNTGE